MNQYVRCQCGNSVPVPLTTIEDFHVEDIDVNVVCKKVFCDRCNKSYVFKFELQPTVVIVMEMQI